MALTSFLPTSTTTTTTSTTNHHHKEEKKKKKKRKMTNPNPPPPPAPAPSSSWEQFKSLLSCRIAAASQVHDPSTNTTTKHRHHAAHHASRGSKLGSMTISCGSSICALRDVVHGSNRVVHRPDTDHSSSSDDGAGSVADTTPLSRRRSAPAAATPSRAGGGGMQLRRLSGCYECHAVSTAGPAASRRYPRPMTLCECSHCGEVFTKSESLELHQSIRHAVSELGPEDSGRNIVEIIFKSSWLVKRVDGHPLHCNIDRILKVHNTARTVARFEDYRSSVKATSTSAGAGRKKNPRCAADGNELLRFHCTSLRCSLGAHGSTALCLSSHSSSAAGPPPCGVCTVIRHGFSKARHHPLGVGTTASSGRAHHCGGPEVGGGRRAMLVCRVIAGRVRRGGGGGEDVEEEEAAAAAAAGGYDSVAGEEGPFGNVEELYVANPRAILPCFVVIYRAID